MDINDQKLVWWTPSLVVGTTKRLLAKPSRTRERIAWLCRCWCDWESYTTEYHSWSMDMIAVIQSFVNTEESTTARPNLVGCSVYLFSFLRDHSATRVDDSCVIFRACQQLHKHHHDYTHHFCGIHRGKLRKVGKKTQNKSWVITFGENHTFFSSSFSTPFCNIFWYISWIWHRIDVFLLRFHPTELYLARTTWKNDPVWTFLQHFVDDDTVGCPTYARTTFRYENQCGEQYPLW